MNFIHYEKCKITRNRAVQQPFVLKVVAFNSSEMEILQRSNRFICSWKMLLEKSKIEKLLTGNKLLTYN